MKLDKGSIAIICVAALVGIALICGTIFTTSFTLQEPNEGFLYIEELYIEGPDGTGVVIKELKVSYEMRYSDLIAVAVASQ